MTIRYRMTRADDAHDAASALDGWMFYSGGRAI
jgi:hypothetical protein